MILYDFQNIFAPLRNVSFNARTSGLLLKRGCSCTALPARFALATVNRNFGSVSMQFATCCRTTEFSIKGRPALGGGLDNGHRRHPPHPPAPAAPAAPCLQPRNIQPRLEQLSTHGRRMQIMFTAWGHSGQEVQGEGGLLCKTKRRRTNETLRLWALLLDRANSWGV